MEKISFLFWDSNNFFFRNNFMAKINESQHCGDELLYCGAVEISACLDKFQVLFGAPRHLAPPCRQPD